MVQCRELVLTFIKESKCNFSANFEVTTKLTETKVIVLTSPLTLTRKKNIKW